MSQTPTNAPVISSVLNENSVLIVQHISEGLQVKKDASNEIFLEGIAAQFGVKNANNRIYEKDEYLPHLQYLNEKISKGQLLGEMDHPQNFDVSLKNVSHAIEGLTYNADSNDVRIKIRLLDTPLGKIAKTLVEAGCTISISSRAAGQVLNEGKVKLHKIFTYDLVHEPGFSQAQLKRPITEGIENSINPFIAITESLNKLKDSSIISKLDDVSENYNFGEGVKIYKSIENAPAENNNQKMNEFVTKTEFNTYSQAVKKRFDSLKENVKLISESTDGAVDVNKLAAYTNYLAEELKTVIKYSNHLASLVEGNISYTEHVAETVNNTIDYTDYIGEKVTQSIQFGEYIGEKLNESVNYQNYIAKKLNESVNFSNYLAETLDKGLQYNDYIAEQVNNVIDYSDYLGEKVTVGINYSEYVAEKLDKNIQFSNYIVEGLNAGTTIVAPETNTQKLVDSSNKLNEALINISESADIDAIVLAVKAVSNKVESNTADAVLEAQYPFLKLMSKQNRDAFGNLDIQTKSDVVKTLGTAIWTNEAEIINIMNAVVEKKNENIPPYIKFMPIAYKEIYEGMTDREKSILSSQSQSFQLHTPYQVKNFWETRDVRGIQERLTAQKLNNKAQQSVNENQGKEGFVSMTQVADQIRGYSSDYVNRFKR